MKEQFVYLCRWRIYQVLFLLFLLLLLLTLCILSILILQVILHYKSFAAESPRFVPSLHFLVLWNHLLLGYCLLIYLEGHSSFHIKINLLAITHWFPSHSGVYLTLLLLQLFQFSLPSFLEMLQHLTLVLLIFSLWCLTWCYYLWFPEVTDLIVNLLQSPHAELCLGFFARVLETICFISSAHVLAFLLWTRVFLHHLVFYLRLWLAYLLGLVFPLPINSMIFKLQF